MILSFPREVRNLFISMLDRLYYVYILASRAGGAIYIGVSSDLVKRIYQHKTEATESHTSKYNIKLLVYYEAHESIEEAILREKRLKKWTRAMKNDLIGKQNPLWEDLYPKLSVG